MCSVMLRNSDCKRQQWHVPTPTTRLPRDGWISNKIFIWEGVDILLVTTALGLDLKSTQISEFRMF